MSCNIRRPRSVITTSRVESGINSCITRRWSSFGSRSTVCSVVTTGMRNSRSSASTWLPAGPPKMPNSCCTQTTSTLVMFRKSAARRYDGRSCSCDFKADYVRIFVAVLEVVHRHGEAFASPGSSAATRSEQIGGECGNAAAPEWNRAPQGFQIKPPSARGASIEHQIWESRMKLIEKCQQHLPRVQFP